MADMNSEMTENEIGNPSVQSVTKKKSNKKKKEGYVFENEEVEFFIYAWSKREVLYDSKNPEYFKRHAKLTAVNQLIEELGFEGKNLNYLHLITRILIVLSFRTQ